MDEVTFEALRPCVEDARQVMEWRNDPDTLRASFHGEAKVWPEFFEEFCREYFSFEELPPVYAVVGGERIAFVRFRSVEGFGRCGEVSLNIAPGWRGKGFGVSILRSCCCWAAERGFDTLYAEVKEDNIASQKVFERAGYKILDKQAKEVHAFCQSYQIYRYLAQLTEF